ncbi:MAG: hypothetical protein ACO3A4_12390 [Silvanigrellaceae bacterium]
MKNSMKQIALLMLAGTLTGCGVIDLQKFTSSQAGQPNPDEKRRGIIVEHELPRACPDIAYLPPAFPKPNVSAFNVAKDRMELDDAAFFSQSSFLYSFPSGKRITLKESNSLLLISGQQLLVVGKKSITLFDISAPDAPQQISQKEVEHEIAGARVVGNSLVIVSTTTLSSIFHPATRNNECYEMPSYTENIYQTRIVRMNLDSLNEEKSIELTGAVTAQPSDNSIRFIEPSPKGTSMRRIVEILPDGGWEISQVGQTLNPPFLQED